MKEAISDFGMRISDFGDVDDLLIGKPCRNTKSPIRIPKSEIVFAFLDLP